MTRPHSSTYKPIWNRGLRSYLKRLGRRWIENTGDTHAAMGGYFTEALLIQSLSLYSLQLMRESRCMCSLQGDELWDAFEFRARLRGKLLIYNRNYHRGTSEGAWQ